MTIEQTSPEDDDLKALADRLIMRHVQVSLQGSATFRQIPRNDDERELLSQRIRCVAVVGAGASYPILERGKELAGELEGRLDKRFPEHKSRREAELSRLSRVYGMNRDHFEARLAALSATAEGEREVRRAIAKQYAIRHPTILGYELLAHLLKHRFLDAIISFNFDELLDQSLDDELGPNEYRRLVSDRDCGQVLSNPDADDYLPLYVKLHGTASEPDTLRFTREAYYQLPESLMTEVEHLFDGQQGVIVNVGCGMSGFDLHRLLRIPQHLDVFDLSWEALKSEVQDEITAERETKSPDAYYPSETRDAPRFYLPAHLRAANGVSPLPCDWWLSALARQIDARTGESADPGSAASVVRFRSVTRHVAVAKILGAEATLSRWTKDIDNHKDDYVDYLRKRTVLELAFAVAKARGLAQLSWLALDRSGVYYEAYCRAAGPSAVPWNDLRDAAGLVENGPLPDVVESDPELCPQGAPPTVVDGRWTLREFAPTELAEHVVVALRTGKASTAVLADALTELQRGSEVEIHSRDDRVCSKVFKLPKTLSTITALDAHTKHLFRGLRPEDHVYISCETGEWLLNKQMEELLLRQDHVEVITAFELKFGEIRRRYGEERLHLDALGPWRHNRHMTIVCKEDRPSRAVYFARRLRTPLITPVYFGEQVDAERVMRTFDLMKTELTDMKSRDVRAG